MSLELPQVRVATSARPGRERESRGETPRMLLERLDAEQFLSAD